MPGELTEAADSARYAEFESASPVETVRIGHELARRLAPGKLYILRGTLGAGKTTLVKGIAEALGAADPDEVTSPTFTLIHEYEGSRDDQPVYLYHLDLYRLENERQVEQLGLDDLLEEDSILLVEWGEKFPSVVRRACGEIRMESTGGDCRKVTLALKD